MMTWTEEQIDTWCRSFHAYRKHDSAPVAARGIQQQRCRVRQEVLHHLQAFLDGRSTLQEFSTAFQPQAHSDWTLLGIHGLSGSTFLKKLVQQIPDANQLTHHLQSALLVPAQVRDAHQEMHTFHLFLEKHITEGQMSRAQLQPDRVPFFLSTWWHIQHEEAWPRFSGPLRQYLLKELPLPNPVNSQIDLYFAFRERFFALQTAFGISAWELECFLHWHQQEQRKEPTMASSAHQKGTSISLWDETSRRLSLQWLLAKIGKKVGCQIWIARQDQGKCWKDERLEQLSVASPQAWEHVSDETLWEDIAVFWLLKNEVIAAWEIGSMDAKLTAPLLRLYDFGLAWAKPRTRYCLVLPQRQFEQAHLELARPIFCQHQEKYPCRLISEEDLTQNGEHILRWASHPGIIEEMMGSSKK